AACNILAPVESIPFLVVIGTFIFSASATRRITSCLLFLISVILGATASLVVLWLLDPEIVLTSIRSLLFFVREGRHVFADQFWHSPSMFLIYPRTAISLFLLAALVWWVVAKIIDVGLLCSIREEIGLLILSIGIVINTFLVTGNVISTFGAVFLV